jgi:uncharacterized protein
MMRPINRENPFAATWAKMFVPWLRRHALLAYLVMAYGISWSGIVWVMAVTGFDLVTLRSTDTAFIFVAMLLGPSLAGLAMTALLDGNPGLRNLWQSLVRWQVEGRWYAVALLTAPTLLLTILLTFSFVDAAFAPRFQWALFAIVLIAGGLEEIGWTGFATTRLLARRNVLMAGLSLGVVWALWHGLVDFRQNANAMGVAWLIEFAVLYVAALAAYRVLMTWVYAHTQSLVLAILMHASYTGWLLVLYPDMAFGQGLAWKTAFAASLWLMVAVVFAGLRRRGPQLAFRFVFEKSSGSRRDRTSWIEVNPRR